MSDTRGVVDQSISVVICAYTEDRWDDLVAAIQSAHNQDRQALEIIVVIDHNPSLLQRAQSELSQVRVVENHEARGLGGARNSGIAAAQGTVVAFLDDDAEASPQWLAELNASYKQAEIAGVGGRIEPLWLGGRPRWFPDEFGWVLGYSYRGMPENSAVVRNVHGCNMSFRRQVFDSVGTFKLGYGCDETELCIRLHQRLPEKVVLYNPRATVRHRVSASRATFRYLCTRCFFEGSSKAVVSWMVGPKDGLASERTHALRTLPLGMLRGVADSVLRGDPGGVERTAAIAVGLACTVAGYISGKLSVRAAARERGLSELMPQKVI